MSFTVHADIQGYGDHPSIHLSAIKSLLCDLKVTICKMGMALIIPVLKPLTFVELISCLFSLKTTIFTSVGNSNQPTCSLQGRLSSGGSGRNAH